MNSIPVTYIKSVGVLSGVSIIAQIRIIDKIWLVAYTKYCGTSATFE